MLHTIVTYIANQPTSTWTTIAAYLGTSTLVASVLQVIKHWKGFAEAKKLVVALLGLLSFLAGFADWIIQTNATNPIPTIGHSTAYIMSGAVLIHRFAVSPVYEKGFTKVAQIVEDAKTYRATIAPQPVSPAEVSAPAAQTFQG